jgi:hypothetical protein
MTADRRDLDPGPEQSRRPVSSEWARRMAKEATEAAVRAAKEKRGARFGEES